MSVIGRSGSGKSTFLNLVGGIENPTSGEVFFDGKSIHQFKDKELTKFRNQHIGYVFQQYHLLADEPTGNLDKQSGDQIIRFMKETNRLFGQTYIIVTHNKEIADYTDREITIDDGEIINDIDLLDVRENEVIK